MFVEALRDRRVDGIHLQRQVRREHHRGLSLRRIMSIGRGGCDASGIRLGSILLCAGRARPELIVVVVEVVEESVIPLRRVIGPGTLEPACDCVVALAAAKLVLPAKTLLLQAGCFRFGTDVFGGRGSSVGLADGVTADDERNGLLVIHRHAGERLSNELRGARRVRIAPWPFWIDVDKAHMIGAERPAHLPAIGVALISEPCFFGPPENFVGLPAVLSPKAEAEGLEAHGLISTVAGENYQIGPRDFVAVLLFYWPEQPPRLVEARIVGP